MSRSSDTMITLPANLDKTNYPDPIESLMSFRAISRSSHRVKSSQEVRNLSRLAKRYQRDVEISDANYEINQFEHTHGLSKKPYQKKNVPIPEGVDLDMISDLDVRMTKQPKNSPQDTKTKRILKPPRRYSSTSRAISAVHSPVTRKHKEPEELHIPFNSKTGHPGMYYKCPACNPQPGEREPEVSSTIHIPRGGCHWQLLDGPELPKTTLIPKSYHQSSRPFLLPARHIGQPGIQLLVDDLVEIREHDQALFEKRVERLRQKDKNMYDSIVRNRVMSSMEQNRKFRMRTEDLERRSGQLKVVERLSKKPPPPKVEEHADPEDVEAIAALNKYDDALWSDYQYRKKNDAVSQLMVQESAQALRSATKPLFD